MKLFVLAFILLLTPLSYSGDFEIFIYELSHLNRWMSKNSTVSNVPWDEFLQDSKYFTHNNSVLALTPKSLSKFKGLPTKTKDQRASAVLKEFWGIVSMIDRFYDQNYDTEQKYDDYIKARKQWRNILDQLTVMYINADQENWQSPTNKELYVIMDGWIQNEVYVGNDATQIFQSMHEILENDEFEDLTSRVSKTKTINAIESLFQGGDIYAAPYRFKCYQMDKCITSFKAVLLDLSKNAKLYLK
ncbi:MAG: hypothetical protein KC646_05030 [Candidatus Cloacimonetes bacterium]|nr:hypothetical protein [Candidatus Cloacimonadota bacterium]